MQYLNFKKMFFFILAFSIIPLTSAFGDTFTDRAAFEAAVGSVVTVDFEGIATEGGQAGAAELEGDEFPGITLTPGSGADGLFVGIPDPTITGGNNVDFFAADFFPTSPVACFSPDMNPSSGSGSPDGTLIVDFDLPTNGVGAYFLDPEGFASSIEAFEGPDGTGSSLGKVIVQSYPDDAQAFAGIAAIGIKSAVLVIGGGGDGVAIDDLCYGLLGIEEVPLCAGQHEVIGSVIVGNDGSNILTVTYHTEEPWYLAETHLATDADPDGIPTTKKGNPIPGQFFNSGDHDPLVQEVSYTVDASSYCGSGPILGIAAHAAVVGILEAAPYSAGSVVGYYQGTTKGGSSVDQARSEPVQALSYETGQNASNFFSLGFNVDGSDEPGFIIVEFDCPIVNGDGDDLRIVEDTWDGLPGGSYPLEEAEIWGSQDAASWNLLGIANNSNKVTPENVFNDFDLGTLEWIKYVKIVDVTNPVPHKNNADAFDVNAVISLQDCMDPETAWGDGCDGDRFNEKTTWATYFEYGLICPIIP